MVPSNDDISATGSNDVPDKQIQVWTSVSYNWIDFETRASPFLAESDPEAAATKFRKLHPRENLLALIPGEHTTDDGLRTFKLSIGCQ
jgi:hypothetical protein